MKSSFCRDYISEILFTKRQIDDRICQVAKQIEKDYADKDVIIIGVLNGASPTVVELLFNLQKNVQSDWVAISSYGDAKETSGKVRVLKEPSLNLEGRDVLIVDDIADSNLTAQFLRNWLLSLGAKSVEIFALLQKEGRQQVDIDIKYVGFTIDDRFVIGYGMDSDKGRFRNLEDIAVLDPKHYT